MESINKVNFQRFVDVYREQLIKMHSLHPEQYAWNISELDQVMSRMIEAIKKGSFNKDSWAFRATCKELKIKHTYKAISDFISL